MAPPLALPWTGLPPGSSPGVWGPRGWRWLHLAAIAYPDSPTPADRLAAHGALWAFLQTIPCPECRVHAHAYARADPPDLSGAAGYQAWAWRFHNAVRRRLGKPPLDWAGYVAVYAEDYRKKEWGVLAAGVAPRL